MRVSHVVLSREKRLQSANSFGRVPTEPDACSRLRKSVLESGKVFRPNRFGRPLSSRKAEHMPVVPQLHGAHGNKWTEIAARMPGGGRTDNACKNQYHKLQQTRHHRQQQQPAAAAAAPAQRRTRSSEAPEPPVGPPKPQPEEDEIAEATAALEESEPEEDEQEESSEQEEEEEEESSDESEVRPCRFTDRSQ